jgi:hypothetical protein
VTGGFCSKALIGVVEALVNVVQPAAVPAQPENAAWRNKRILPRVEPCQLAKEAFMRAKLLAAAALAAFVTPALAAEFYVVQDTSSKRCQIVEQRPTTQTSVVVGDGKVFTTRTEAESAMKTIQICSTTTGGPSTTTTTTVPAR